MLHEKQIRLLTSWVRQAGIIRWMRKHGKTDPDYQERAIMDAIRKQQRIETRLRATGLNFIGTCLGE